MANSTKHTVTLTHKNEDDVKLDQKIAEPLYNNIVKNYNAIINDLQDVKKELKKQQSNGFTGNLKAKIGTYISKTETYIEREKNRQNNLKIKYNNAVNRLALSLTDTLNDIIKNDKNLTNKTPSEVLAGLLTGTVSISTADMTRLQDTIINGNSALTQNQAGATTPTGTTNVSGTTTPANTTNTTGTTTPANTTGTTGTTTPANTTGAGTTTSIGIDVGDMTMSEFTQLSPVDKNTVNNILSGNITASVSTDGSNIHYFTDSSGISYPITGDPVVVLGNGTAVRVPISSSK